MNELRIYRTSPHGKQILAHEGPLPWKVEDPAPISVVIPSIPPRLHMLNRALKSIERQTLQPEEVIVQMDHLGEGAAVTRNKGLSHVVGAAAAFLDDDDYMGQDHLKLMYLAMLNERADYVYPWFWIAGPSYDPFQHLDWHMKPWRDDRPHQTTITTLVRRDLAQEVGFRAVDHDKWPEQTEEGFIFGEDYQFTRECLNLGAKIHHVQDRTWAWVVTGHNTSGRAEAWEHAR